MALRQMEMMRERGKSRMISEYIEGIYAMLEKIEDCVEESDEFGERDGMDGSSMGERYPIMGERRSRTTGRYIR